LLLKNHIYLTNLFNELEQNTYLRARYDTLDLNQDTGKIHMEGVVDSYNGLGKLLLGLGTSPHFRSVKLITVMPATSTTSGYQFSLDVVASLDVFNKK